MIPSHFYHNRKSIQPRFSYTPTGDLEINQLLRNKPYWRQSVASTIKENKTLVLADWSAQNWSNEKLQLVKDKLFELLHAGFSIYAWQSGQVEELNKDNIAKLLSEPSFLERMTSPEMPREIEKAAISQLPNVSKDSLLILDDYQVQGLLQPEVYDYPRELDVSELLKYKHNLDKLIPILGKMNPPLTGFTDTEVSEESYSLLEKLQVQLPDIPIKSQFKSAKLTAQTIDALMSEGKATVARRILLKEQLQDLEEVTLENISAEALRKILPYLSNVKKLTLLNCKNSLRLTDDLPDVLPSLEKIKLVGTHISTTDLVSIIKNSSQLKKLDIYGSHINDDGPLAPLASRCFNTIKIKHGVITKRNFQDLLLRHKISRILFSGGVMISDSLTEIKDTADLSSIKKFEIDGTACDATYLNQMFELLPQLEHLCIRGGQIKSFTNTFSLKSLKTLEMDVARFNDIASAFDGLKIEKLILTDNNTATFPKLSNLDLSRMEYFSISKNQLNHQFLELLLKRSPQLKHLELQGCTNLHALKSKFLWNNIHTLNLSKTDISTESLENILENAPNLKRLDLSGCTGLVLTPKLRGLLNRIQVYYPDHIKTERKKPDYSVYKTQGLSDPLMQQLLEPQKGGNSENSNGCGNSLDTNNDSGTSQDANGSLSQDALNNLSADDLRKLLNNIDPSSLKDLDLSQINESELADKLKDLHLDDLLKGLNGGNVRKVLQALVDSLNKKGTEGSGEQEGEEISDKDAENSGSSNQDEFLDADTSNKGQEFSTTVIFFPVTKDAPLPPVSQYREKIFNEFVISPKPCPINQAFTVKQTGDLQLKPCDAQRCSKDVFSEGAQLEDSSEHHYYYGKTALKLTQKWQPLPSLSAQEELTHYHIEPNSDVELHYSLRDNQYYIRSKKKIPSTVSIDFLLKVPVQSKTLPLEIQKLVDHFAGSLVEEGFGEGALDLDGKSNGMGYLKAILEQKKGACRHRSIAFSHLMKERFPEIPVRIMANTVHMQVEVLVDGQWVSCNLGGYTAKLNLNTKNDPWKKEQSVFDTDDNGHLLKEDAKIAQYLQTWKKTKKPELTLESYCEQLTEPREQKKYLIETNNPTSQQALALAIKAHCKQSNKPLFYIRKPDNLTCSAPYITNKDNIGLINEGPGGPLHAFLTQTYDKNNPPVLLINAEEFDTDDLVQHNSLFDEPPKVDGVPLPEGTIVLLLMDASKPNFTLGEDLTSRMDVIEQCPVQDKTLHQAYPPVVPKQAKTEDKTRPTLDLGVVCT